MIQWLSTDQVMQINAYQMAAFGGIAGVRDAGALESAVFSPRNAHAYTGAGLFECAALYAERISRSQAFLDGNKRTGLHAALLFLAANGQQVAADPDLEYLMMALTLQELDVTPFAAMLESRSSPMFP